MYATSCKIRTLCTLRYVRYVMYVMYATLCALCTLRHVRYVRYVMCAMYATSCTLCTLRHVRYVRYVMYVMYATLRTLRHVRYVRYVTVTLRYVRYVMYATLSPPRYALRATRYVINLRRYAPGGGQFYPQNLARCASQPHPPVKNYIFSPELHVFHPPPVSALVKSDNTRTDYTTWNGDGSEEKDLAKRIKVAYRAPAAQAYITPSHDIVWLYNSAILEMLRTVASPGTFGCHGHRFLTCFIPSQKLHTTMIF